MGKNYMDLKIFLLRVPSTIKNKRNQNEISGNSSVVAYPKNLITLVYAVQPTDTMQIKEEHGPNFSDQTTNLFLKSHLTSIQTQS